MTRNPQARTSSGKLKITITIDPDQVAIVDRIADQRRTSRGSIVRQAIDFYLARIMDDVHIPAVRIASEEADDAA